MDDFIIDLMNQYGYFGIFLLIFIENIFPPIPSEIILTFGGFMTTYAGMNVFIVILVSTLGSFLGAIMLYLIGRLLSVERLERLFASKLGRLLRLKKEDVKKAETQFSKHGKKAVFICRFIPIVRSLISIPAGISKMKMLPFLTLTLIGTLIWNTVLIFLGRAMGGAWETIAGYMDTYSLIALVAIAAVCLIAAFIFIKVRFLNKKPATENENSIDGSDEKIDKEETK